MSIYVHSSGCVQLRFSVDSRQTLVCPDPVEELRLYNLVNCLLVLQHMLGTDNCAKTMHLNFHGEET